MFFFFFSSRRRHTRFDCDWSSDVCSSDLWRNTLYPYVYYSSIDGLWGAIHFSEYSPIGYLERPEPNRAAATLEVSASTQGSYLILADAQAPAWWEGWRAAPTFRAPRLHPRGYYGLGNPTRYFADSVT